VLCCTHRTYCDGLRELAVVVVALEEKEKDIVYFVQEVSVCEGRLLIPEVEGKGLMSAHIGECAVRLLMQVNGWHIDAETHLVECRVDLFEVAQGVNGGDNLESAFFEKLQKLVRL
jgi:hypothetical protein